MLGRSQRLGRRLECRARSRAAWVLDPTFTQPLDLVGGMVRGLADAYEAAAEAEVLDELFVRAEACGQIQRLDPEVEPNLYHAATLSAAPRQQLGTITHVIRKGRVCRISADELLLDEGSVATTRQQVHVDCTARGLGTTTAGLRGAAHHTPADARRDAAVQRRADRVPRDHQT